MRLNGSLPSMNSSQLLIKLTEIDRAIGVVDFIELRKMVQALEDYIFESQKETVQQLREKSPHHASGH
jgi:hypothetical protein